MKKALAYVLDIYNENEIKNMLNMAGRLHHIGLADIAILSDVLNYKTPEEMIEDGFDQKTVDALKKLKRRKGERWNRYAKRIREDKVYSIIAYIKILDRMDYLDSLGKLTPRLRSEYDDLRWAQVHMLVKSQPNMSSN